MTKLAGKKKSLGSWIVGLAAAFDEHCIIYLGMLCGVFVFVAEIINPNIKAEAAPVAAGGFWFLSVFVYYILKSIFITAETCLTWKTRYPGVPFIRTGTLTEYDTDMTKAIGAEVARAIASQQNSQNQHKCSCCGGEHDGEK